MKKALILLLLMALPAMGLTWSEDFNSYPSGTPDWGVSAAANGWNLPTTSTNLDGYVPSGGSGLSPRMGNLYNYAETSLGGGIYGATVGQDVVLTYKAGFSRANNESEQLTPGSDFIALGTPSSIAAIPAYTDGPLSEPIAAVAFGHQNGLTRHYFFNGQEWIRTGSYSQSVPFTNDMRYGTGAVTMTMQADGSIVWSSGPMGTFNLTHLVPGFTFTTLALSHENAMPSSSAPASYDDLGLTAADVPEPATLVLFGLAGVALLRRRR